MQVVCGETWCAVLGICVYIRATRCQIPPPNALRWCTALPSAASTSPCSGFDWILTRFQSGISRIFSARGAVGLIHNQ
ncbi:hypothetical protein B0H11DRAFT_848171 [Mycena galericulata]|nr:hypothetical protein B0H11DRAFT_848171 [Mycena galericulata]